MLEKIIVITSFYIDIENETLLDSSVQVEDFRDYFTHGNKVFIDFLVGILS